MAIEVAADLIVATIDALTGRAPAVIAAAAHELGSVQLSLHFGDGSHASLKAERSRLIAAKDRFKEPAVEAMFDDRALKLLFDHQQRPTDQVFASSLDVRGSRKELLAVWRCFALLAQRASGLRVVQALWSTYRERYAPQRWSGRMRKGYRAHRRGIAYWEETRWPALAYLNERYPADLELLHEGSDPVLAPGRSLWDGRRGLSWRAHGAVFDNDLDITMRRLKARVVDEILRLVPMRQPRADLYNLMRDYVTRPGKGLRPTLMIATCMALGGRPEDAVRAAAALEMFHNGFLVHDDIADESTHRRGKPTLHMAHGTGLAVNAGDAMNLFAVDLVLSNLPTLGLARTLGLIHEVLHMCRETVEGQAIELGWIRRNFVPHRDADYSRMSTKKTGWYTCISPCRMGAIAAGETRPELLDRFNEAFRLIGIAFQIQDDLLNLTGETALYGKEPLGDLLEGKRTIMMIHLFRTANDQTRRRITKLNRLHRAEKSQAEAVEILDAMRRFGSLDYGASLADRLARKGVALFERDLAFVDENPAKAVLRQVANYVTTRLL
jgi:geranylgeranyl diphosphate synthase type II